MLVEVELNPDPEGQNLAKVLTRPQNLPRHATGPYQGNILSYIPLWISRVRVGAIF